MAVLDALGARLATDGIGTVGTNIFLSQMQDEPDVAVCLFEGQNAPPLYSFGASAILGSRPRIRVIARAGRHDYVAARAKIQAVLDSLGVIRSESISGVSFKCVLATTDIYPLNRDAEERPVLAVDFVAWIAP